MSKRMTIEQLRAAKDRAVQMFQNFGRKDDAEEFEALTLDEYADRQGIEVIGG